MTASIPAAENDGPAPNTAEIISDTRDPPRRSRLARIKSKLKLRRRFTAADLTSFQWTHILFLLNITAITLWSLLLASCTPSLRSIALLTLSYKPSPTPSPSPLQSNPDLVATFLSLTSTPANATVRLRAIAVGFTSTCLHLAPDAWTCGPDLSAVAADLAAGSDPLNLLWVVEQYRTGIAWYGLIIVAMVLTGIATVLLALGILRSEDEAGDASENGSRASSSARSVKRPWSEAFARPIFALMGLAFLVSFISAVWQHMASAATLTLVTALTYDTVEGSVGGTAMAFAWVGALLALSSVLGTLLSIVSRRIIDDYERSRDD
ncbi:Ca2+ regulator and membrane fusion protein Fig1-domain-containing protein [Lasiosphaeria hispida]|uniref:Ca2+ regulator and membrane fusion protein Fig1-domain-containing protein n=1 Tax=Lasiosphaeria hispida TaxID=260671 RepID=A0AAJ0M9A6_9PEZI|nr:Ca2+ regulator and membrane fusion protein Fig1-domain-containing protein [Lasiosphaeria hispida]